VRGLGQASDDEAALVAADRNVHGCDRMTHLELPVSDPSSGLRCLRKTYVGFRLRQKVQQQQCLIPDGPAALEVARAGYDRSERHRRWRLSDPDFDTHGPGVGVDRRGDLAHSPFRGDLGVGDQRGHI
jgi:hypothetical protein